MATKIKKSDRLSNSNYLIVLILITLLVIGLTVLAGNVLVKGIVRNTKVLDAKSKANKTLDSDLVNAPLLITEYEQKSNEKKLISDALPDDADLPGFMALMESLTGSAGVTLKTVTPSISSSAEATAGAPVATPATGAEGVKPPKPQTYGVAMTVDTTYPALGRMLAAIEQSARPIRITGLQITGSGSVLTVQMDAITYYQDKAKLPFSTETIK